MSIYQPFGSREAICPTCGKRMRGYSTVNPEVTGPMDVAMDDPCTFVADPCGHGFASISFPPDGGPCVVRPLPPVE